MLSVIIPARNEDYLETTIRNVLENARGEIEVLTVLDGWLPDPPIDIGDPRVKFFHFPESIGQRQAINFAANQSNAEFIMKLDAHCAVGEAFDTILAADCEYDWTMIPRMYNLDIKTFTPKKHKRTDYMYMRLRDNGDLRAEYYGGREYKRLHKRKELIDETMCCMGPCFFQHRKRFLELGGCDEKHGGWGQQGIEVACKAWLSGGKLVVNKKTWFSHWFRGGGGPGFPYKLSGKQVAGARKYSKDLWMGDKWPQAVRSFDWLLKKFNPPNWDQYMSTLGIIYISANKEEEGLTDETFKTFQRNRGKVPFVAVTHKPIGLEEKNNIVVGEQGWSAQNQLRQILLGAQALKTDYVVLCESDCLYPEEYFKIPPGDYNCSYFDSIWMLTDKGFIKKKKPSQCALIAKRQWLIEEIEKRLEGRPGWNTFLERGEDKIPNFEKQAALVSTKQPIVNIHHNKNMHRKLTAVTGEYKPAIKYWGDAAKIWAKINNGIFLEYKYHLVRRDVEAFYKQMPTMFEPGKTDPNKPGCGAHFLRVFVPFMQALADGYVYIKGTKEVVNPQDANDKIDISGYYEYLKLKLNPADRDPLTKKGNKHIYNKMADAANLFNSIKSSGIHTPIDCFYHKGRQVIVRGGRRLVIAHLLGIQTVVVRRFKDKRDFRRSLFIIEPRSGGRIERAAQTLFVKYGKQKGPNKYYMHNYPVYYDRVLEPMYRTKESLKILEIGVQRGYSMMLWRKAFPKAHIIGVDIKNVSHKEFVKKANINEFVHGDATDPKVLAYLRKRGPYDIILDDGSHHPKDQIAAFKGLWSAVRGHREVKGITGFYIIEDLFHSYKDQAGVYDLLDEVVKKIKGIYRYEVASVICYPNIVFFEKA